MNVNNPQQFSPSRFVLSNIKMQVRKQQFELDMEQQTGSKQKKEFVKAVYCHPAYSTYMHRVHRQKRWAGRSTSWNQDCWERYQ